MNSDLLYLLSSRLDYTELEKLCCAGLWSEILLFVKQRFWWYLRACHLFQTELNPRPGSDWRRAYLHLEVTVLALGSQKTSNPFTVARHNLLAVEVLIELGCDPSQDESEALALAAQDEQVEVVKLLLEDGRSHPGADDNDALVLMIEKDELEWAKRLVRDPCVDPSADRDRALRTACMLGKAEAVEVLLEDERVDPMQEGEGEPCALTEATQNGRVSVLELLLRDERCDPSGRDNEAVISAAWSGSCDAVRLLFSDPRVDPSADDNHAMRCAVDRGYGEIQKLLLADPRVAATWSAD